MISEEAKNRFLKKFKMGLSNECWEWSAGKFSDGYGCFQNNKSVYAHRVSYEIFKGVIPNGLCVCHSCDNPGCVNPNHLWVGTMGDNMIDRDRKGRHVRLCGIRNGGFGKGYLHSGDRSGTAKLDWIKVRKIRGSNLSGVALAKKFNVSTSIISEVRNFKTWKVNGGKNGKNMVHSR